MAVAAAETRVSRTNSAEQISGAGASYGGVITSLPMIPKKKHLRHFSVPVNRLREALEVDRRLLYDPALLDPYPHQVVQPAEAPALRVQPVHAPQWLMAWNFRRCQSASSISLALTFGPTRLKLGQYVGAVGLAQKVRPPRESAIGLISVR